jgi:hypothetical protein
MDLLASFGAATAAVTLTKDILKTAVNEKIDSEAKIKVQEAREKLNEIQDVIYTLKDELFRLQDVNRDLKLKLEESKSLQNYEITATDGGAVVYRFKNAPEHFACPTCYSEGSIQILQDANSMAKNHNCTKCKSSFYIKQKLNQSTVGYVQPRSRAC